MDLKNAKLLGGIGAILMFGVLFKKFGTFLTIVGVILTLIALKDLADKFKRSEIFSNYLIAFILHIVISILFIVGSIASLFALGLTLLFSFRLSVHLGAGFIILLVVLYALYAVSGYFVKKSFDEVSDATKVTHFRTAGLLLFIGAVLLIVFGLGALIALIGYVFEIVAFFSLPDSISLPQENSV